ncbi:MAG: thiol:disulfide interchange protein DsbA/DsbL, partial [Pseudomonadota bacterium]
WLLPLLLLPALAQAAEFQEGRNYTRIVPAQPTESKSKIEVVELFWYGCPHCYRFQPYLERWVKQLPADVEYRRMPATLAEHWIIHARAFYAAEALGVLDKIHKPLFDAIHAQKRRLDTEERLMEFFAEQGVSNDDFKKTFNSFSVEAKVRRAKEMSRRYQTEATPSIVINGKYILNPGQVEGNFNAMLKVMDFLIEKERKGL